MERIKIFSWLRNRFTANDRKKYEKIDDTKDLPLSDIVEYLKAEPNVELASKGASEVNQISNEYIIPVKTVRDVWIALHNERKVIVSGNIKSYIVEKNPTSGVCTYKAFLDDGTAKLAIRWNDYFSLSNNSGATYSVVGICRSEDGIRSYLDNCTITLLSSGIIYEKVVPSIKEDTYTGSNVLNSKVSSHSDTEKASGHHGSTGSNWTKSFSGDGVQLSSSWQYWREKAFKRDSYKCVQCGSTDNLTVDHIQPLGLGGKNEINNLQTLCGDCHEDKHYCNFLDKKFDANDDYGANYRPSNKIQTIIMAVNNKSKVKINYVDREGVKSLRIILPKKIYKGYRYQGKTVCVNCVYVDAYCEKDRDNRTFRLSRMGTIDNI